MDTPLLNEKNFFFFFVFCLLRDRKSTRVNSSHLVISYAGFCSSHPLATDPVPRRRSSDLLRTVYDRSYSVVVMRSNGVKWTIINYRKRKKSTKSYGKM